jgi:nucleotide-binding universal stress UspA family protein
MISSFKKILVPVDFSERSDIAVQKAIELAEPFVSVISLLYVVKPLFSLNIFSSTGYLITPATEIYFESEIEKRMDEYRSMVAHFAEGVKIELIISEHGPIQERIEQAAELFEPDLIIICKRGNRSLFTFFNLIFPDRLAKKTDCPVLTIKQGSAGNRIRNIVLPVTWRYPARKLELAIVMARKFGANIHLMTFPENETENDNREQAFIDSFNRIRENSSVIVKHGPLKGHDIARAVLCYSEAIKADMILANPQTESSIRSLTGKRHISDMLPANSSIQVMDIEPYHPEPYSLTN